MNAFGGAISVLSCSLFVASLIKLIAPVGKTEKILKLVISIFILICLVTCISSVADEFKKLDANVIPFETINDASSEVDKTVLKVTGDYMAEYIENLLSANNVDFDKIYVTVNTDENEVINITDICIHINESNTAAEKISEIIIKDLKIVPRIVVNE